MDLFSFSGKSISNRFYFLMGIPHPYLCELIFGQGRNQKERYVLVLWVTQVKYNFYIRTDFTLLSMSIKMSVCEVTSRIRSSYFLIVTDFKRNADRIILLQVDRGKTFKKESGGEY